jgi:hypothetical protein
MATTTQITTIVYNDYDVNSEKIIEKRHKSFLHRFEQINEPDSTTNLAIFNVTHPNKHPLFRLKNHGHRKIQFSKYSHKEHKLEKQLRRYKKHPLEILNFKNLTFNLNDSMIFENNTTTKMNMIDSINQSLRANEPSLTIAFVVCTCIVSIILCGCLLKMCYPKEESDSHLNPTKNSTMIYNEEVVADSENTPVLHYSRTEQKNIEKFY